MGFKSVDDYLLALDVDGIVQAKVKDAGQAEKRMRRMISNINGQWGPIPGHKGVLSETIDPGKYTKTLLESIHGRLKQFKTRLEAEAFFSKVILERQMSDGAKVVHLRALTLADCVWIKTIEGECQC